MQKIVTHLWFDDKAEEAVKFYTSLFQRSKIGRISRYTGEISKVAGRPDGSIMTIEFELDGQQFLALNGGPQFKFNESMSLLVNCETQQEIDELWSKLTDGGQEQPCGWLKDKYGLSWQINPARIEDLITKDAATTDRVMRAMLQMKKLDKKKLEDAARG